MKVLFDHPSPFLLAHGGFQIQIEQTKTALERTGVEIEYLRWWDERQRGDVIHFFGRPGIDYVRMARQKGIKVVMAELLTGLSSRPAWLRNVQRSLMSLSSAALPDAFTARLGWESYHTADAYVALTAWEAHLMGTMFGAPPLQVHVIPNGVEDVFLTEIAAPRGPWLVCTATITPRKRVCELAEAAVAAKTPLWVIGMPYAEQDPYAIRFLALARQHSRWIRYEGAISDRARLAQAYREARGFVLLSAMESLSLSALEAAACGCPLLLSNLPWAHTVFGATASYCPVTRRRATTALNLRRFYDQAPQLPTPPKPKTWLEVAGQLNLLYTDLLRTS